MTPLKNHNTLLVTDLKEKEICNLPDRELKIFVLRKLKELLENRKRIQQNCENNT